MQPLRSPVQKRAKPETTLNTWGSPVCIICSCSLTLSCPTLWCHGLQHVRFSCSSPSPGVCPSSCLLCPWCNPTISSCAAPFSSCLQSFLATGSSPISWLFALGGQSIRASASVLAVNSQGWLTGLISLQSKGVFQSLLQHHCLKVSILQHPTFFMCQLSYLYMTIGKTIVLTV